MYIGQNGKKRRRLMLGSKKMDLKKGGDGIIGRGSWNIFLICQLLNPCNSFCTILVLHQSIKLFFEMMSFMICLSYEAWSYKKGNMKKDYRIQKICLERIYS